MKLKAWAKLLMVGMMVISSVSGAQMWGAGMWGGMQPCPWGSGGASGASDEDDEVAELKQDRIELRQEKRRLERLVSQMERDRDRLKEGIDEVVSSAWAEIAFKHMDQGMNCCIVGAAPIEDRVPSRPIRAEPEPARPPAPPAPAPPAPAPPVEQRVAPIREARPVPVQQPPDEPPKQVQRVAPIREAKPVPVQQQPPRAEVEPRPVVIRSEPPAPVEQKSEPHQEAANPVKPAKPELNFTPGEDCDVKVKKLTKKGKRQKDGSCKWTSIELPKSDRMPASFEGGDRAPAAAAEAEVKLSASGEDRWGNLNSFGGSFGSGEKDRTLCYESELPYVAMKGERELSKPFSAICKKDGYISASLCTNRYFQKGEVRGPQATNCSRSLERYRKLTKEIDKAKVQIGKLENEIADIGLRIGDLKMAARFDKDMEADCPSGKCYESGYKRAGRSRGPSALQTGLAVGLDALSIFANYKVANKANEWNARTGNEALPYATNIGGFFPYNTAMLYGGMYGGVNGGFGCSPTVGGGGSVFGPGGMTGPYGVGGSLYGGVGGAFGYPQGYGYPQYGGGMYMPGAGSWGMNGPWGVGQWPGGYPGAQGFVGGIAGGIAGGYAGMPGYMGGYAGMPGMAGGIAGGIAGGYAGMPGYMGGYAGMPGMAGGIAGGIAGGYAGMPGYMGGYAGMPGMAGGIAGGIAGGYAGMPGMAGGIAGGMAGGFLAPFPGGGTDVYTQQQYLQLQMQQYNLQIEAQRRYQDQAQSRLRLYQGFMQEYMQFQTKWNQAFGSGGMGGDIIFSPGGSGTLPSGSGPTSGTIPGRTR